jgi:hypothetical protein
MKTVQGVLSFALLALLVVFMYQHTFGAKG